MYLTESLRFFCTYLSYLNINNPSHLYNSLKKNSSPILEKSKKYVYRQNPYKLSRSINSILSRANAGAVQTNINIYLLIQGSYYKYYMNMTVVIYTFQYRQCIM